MTEAEACKAELEDAILVVSERVSDAVYRRYVEGEVSPDQMQEVYDMLRRWSQCGEELLRLLN